MMTKLTEQEFFNLHQTVAFKQRNASESDYSEKLYEIQQPIGEGKAHVFDLRCGFELAIEDYQWHEPVKIELEACEHPLEFAFLLSGNTQDQSLQAGQAALCGNGACPSMLFKLAPYERFKIIAVHIKPEIFKRFVGIEEDAIPQEMKHLFRSFDQEYYVHNGMITTQMKLALQQILQCPFEGITRRMYLESKILELMALRLQQGIEGEAVSDSGKLPKREQIDRLHQAKDILERYLENPPPLLEIAEQVGLSHYQLKQGFRKAFGTSPFQYLHQYRMEQARLLLYDGKKRVAEVANMVGYSHLGQFAAVFKRKFGISPHECLMGKQVLNPDQ